MFIMSTQGLCGELPSNLSQPSIALFFSSSLDPITSKLPHFAHSQIGNASPQYLFLDISQSCMFLSQSSSLSSPNLGIQFIFFATSIICCRRVFFCLPSEASGEGRSMAMYHSSTTRQTSSVLHRQQVG